MRRTRQRLAGFTYLWVLLLIALISLGTAVTLDVYQITQQHEKERELLFIGRQFEAALARYSELPVPAQVIPGQSSASSQSITGASPQSATFDLRRFPLNLGDLIEDRRVNPPARHLRRLYVDPMTGKADWDSVEIQGRIIGIRSRSVSTPLKRSGFDTEWASFASADSYARWVFSSPQGRPLVTTID